MKEEGVVWFFFAVYLCIFVPVMGVQMKLVGEFGGRWRLLKTVRGRKDGFWGGFWLLRWVLGHAGGWRVWP